MVKNYYKILSIPTIATEKEVQEGYKRAILKWHPKKTKHPLAQAEKEFANASEAYEVLSTPVLRSVYDAYGYETLISGIKKGDETLFAAYEFKSTSEQVYRKYVLEANPFAILKQYKENPILPVPRDGDLPKFNRPKILPVDENATDIVKIVECSLEDFFYGVSKEVKYVVQTFSTQHGFQPLTKTKKFSVFKGSYDGMERRFPGEGSTSINYITGDLIISLKQKKHERFTRQGNDLYVTVDAFLLDIIQAYPIPVINIDKQIVDAYPHFPIEDYTIPNKGMPLIISPNRRGNLIISFNVKFPDTIYEERLPALQAILGPIGKTETVLRDKKVLKMPNIFNIDEYATDVHVLVKCTLKELFFGVMQKHVSYMKRLPDDKTDPRNKNHTIIADFAFTLAQGSYDGMVIVIPGQGSTNIKGQLGDLVITLEQVPDDRFSRKGDDLFTVIDIDWLDVSKGIVTQFNNINNEVVKVKLSFPLTQQRVLGKGMPLLSNPATRGDLYVDFKLESFDVPPEEYLQNSEVFPQLSLEDIEKLPILTTPVSEDITDVHVVVNCTIKEMFYGVKDKPARFMKRKVIPDKGVVFEFAFINFQVLPGSYDGLVKVIPGQGNTNTKGETGDLTVTLKELPDEIYARDGDDVHIGIDVTYEDLVKKAIFTIENIDAITVEGVPKMPFAEEMIPKRGMPQIVDKKIRGNLYLSYRLVVNEFPQNLYLDASFPELPIRETGTIDMNFAYPYVDENTTDVHWYVRCSLEDFFRGGAKAMKLKKRVVTPARGPHYVNVFKAFFVMRGSFDGMVRSFPGQGSTNLEGKTGTLHIKYHGLPHDIFTRVGDDLKVTCYTTRADINRGNPVKLKNIDGEVLVISPSHSLDDIIIEDKGMVTLKDPGKRGKLIVSFKILSRGENIYKFGNLIEPVPILKGPSGEDLPEFKPPVSEYISDIHVTVYCTLKEFFTGVKDKSVKYRVRRISEERGIEYPKIETKFMLPKGSFDGLQLLVFQRGSKNIIGNTGNLVIMLREMKDERFVRKGDDLYITIDVNDEDLKQGKIKILNVDDKEEIIVSPDGRGTEEFCQGKGMPKLLDPQTRGNLIVSFNVLKTKEKINSPEKVPIKPPKKDRSSKANK